VKKAWELLEAGWCQRSLHEKKDGKDHYCIMGAIDKAYNFDGLRHETKIRGVLRKMGRDGMISSYNDEAGRTQEEVVALVKGLDI